MASCPSEESYGYEDSRFEKDVDENFHCSICYNVLKEPRMCGNNEHMFCLDCITQHLNVNSETCPECNEYLTVDTLRRPRVLNNYLSKLKINCDLASRGCPEFTCVEKLKAHVANCGFAPVLCSNEGCGMEINKKDKIYHETIVCEYREVDENVEAIIQEMKKFHAEKIEEMKESIDEMKEVKKEVKDVKENLSKVTKDVDEIKVVMGQLLDKLNIPNPLNKLPFAQHMLNTARKDILISGVNGPSSTGIFSGFSPPPVYPGFTSAPVYADYMPSPVYQGFSPPEEYPSFGPPGLIARPRPPPAQPVRPKAKREKNAQNVTKFQDFLNPSILAQASAADQKEMLGERLFPLIQQTHRDLAGKITGMLLEMDNAELLHMLEFPDVLAAKVDEAMAVLQAHQARKTIYVPAHK